MVARDARYKLAGLVEMDDSYFGAKKYPGKRGRGSENKATVIVGVQLSEDELPQFTNMIQVENLTEKNVKQTVKEHVVEKSTIKTDGYSSYNVLKNITTFTRQSSLLIQNRQANCSDGSML